MKEAMTSSDPIKCDHGGQADVQAGVVVCAACRRPLANLSARQLSGIISNFLRVIEDRDRYAEALEKIGGSAMSYGADLRRIAQTALTKQKSPQPPTLQVESRHGGRIGVSPSSEGGASCV
jgi:hypothetical protein